MQERVEEDVEEEEREGEQGEEGGEEGGYCCESEIGRFAARDSKSGMSPTGGRSGAERTSEAQLRLLSDPERSSHPERNGGFFPKRS